MSSATQRVARRRSHTPPLWPATRFASLAHGRGAGRPAVAASISPGLVERLACTSACAPGHAIASRRFSRAARGDDSVQERRRPTPDGEALLVQGPPTRRTIRGRPAPPATELSRYLTRSLAASAPGDQTKGSSRSLLAERLDDAVLLHRLPNGVADTIFDRPKAPTALASGKSREGSPGRWPAGIKWRLVPGAS